MPQKSTANPGALWLTLLTGGLIGAVTVSLTTPKTGRELRTALRTLRCQLGKAGADEPGDDDAKLMQFI